MIVSNKNEAQELINQVKLNIEKTKSAVEDIMRENTAVEALEILKFDKVAFDPLDGEEKNFIEVLNQAYSDLVVLTAVIYLLDKYPTKVFELHMGALNGPDIESTDGLVVAECFATVTAFNNRKIQKDCEKLLALESNVDKYLFFYSRDDSDEKIDSFIQKNKEVAFVRFRNF